MRASSSSPWSPSSRKHGRATRHRLAQEPAQRPGATEAGADSLHLGGARPADEQSGPAPTPRRGDGGGKGWGMGAGQAPPTAGPAGEEGGGQPSWRNEDFTENTKPANQELRNRNVDSQQNKTKQKEGDSVGRRGRRRERGGGGEGEEFFFFFFPFL